MNFDNAKVAGTQVTSEQYRNHGKNRGDPTYPMGSSDLRKFMSCPHKWRYGEEGEQTEQTKWGRLIDILLLCPKGSNVSQIIAVPPETYQDSKTGADKPWNWNSNTAKSWKEKNADKLIVMPDTITKATKALRAMNDNPLVISVLSCSTYQVMLTAGYADKETDLTIPICGLLDIVPNAESKHGKMICDLKTTNEAAPFFWGRSIYSRGYHVQAALYLDLWNSTKANKRNSFGHIIQESENPYETCTRLLSEDYIVLGRAQYEAALKAYCKCLQNDKWPGYDEEEGLYDGWTMVSPEPFMVLRSGVQLPDSPLPTFGMKEHEAESGSKQEP